MSQPNEPCLPCPRCSFRIKLTLEQLLFMPDLRCPRCGLALTVDREASRGSLELLQDLHVAMRNLETVKKQSY